MMTEVATQTATALNGFCDWAAAVQWDDLPADMPARAGLILLDDFGSLIAARHEPELVALRAGLARASGPAEAMLHDGRGARMDRFSAALANGAGSDWCELDGGYRLAVCHAAIYCIPALLAEAEATGANLRDTLLALIVGYDCVARVARTYAFPALTMHPHGGLATIGAAAAVAKLRGLSAEDMAAAVNSAAALVVPGPFNHAVEGALMRNVWPGICAQNGLRAVDWVGIGITGGRHALHEVFADIFGATPTPARLTEALGQDFAMRDGYHKMHACCQYSHSMVEALLEATEGQRLDVAKIGAITVATHPKGQMLDNARPATTLAAKFSMQHVAAVTLAFGHAGASAFHADTLTDPAIDRLRGLVSLVAHGDVGAWPEDRPARVSVTVTDGRVLTAECRSAQGGSDRPFDRGQIIAKARANLAETHPRLAGQAEVFAEATDKGLLGRPVSDLLLPG
jgi:2-methylcitrate dehydratase PrpD